MFVTGEVGTARVVTTVVLPATVFLFVQSCACRVERLSMCDMFVCRLPLLVSA